MAGVHWLLFYDYVDDYLEARTAMRPEHLELADAAHERGELVMAGAIADEAPYVGVLVFEADDVSVVERFVEEDPYVQRGLVTSWRIRPWSVVIGGS
jgi:uncharacterized protein YciI